MKILVFQIVFLLIGSVVSIGSDSHDLWKQTLVKFNIDIDTKLIDLFPNMKGIVQIQSMHNNQTELNDCYNMEIGNHTFNIFSDSIYTVIHHYFETHSSFMSRMKFVSKIPYFLENLGDLANLIIECVNNPDPSTRSKFGITSRTIYSKSSYLNKYLYDEPKPMLMSHKKKGHHHHLHKNEDSKSWCSTEKLRSDKKIPKTFNWKDKGYVTPVRPQGTCGCCYIFSSVAAMESQYMINVKKKEIDFSEQAVLNCALGGCDGGSINGAMDHMIKLGVSLEEKAPYKSKVEDCYSYPEVIKADDFCQQNHLTNHEIKRMLLRNGPGVVGINVNQIKHLKGEFNGKCKSKKRNHAVLLVGWTKKHWIIKNSWNENWGINGYLYLPIKDCNCGLNVEFYQIKINKKHKH